MHKSFYLFFIFAHIFFYFSLTEVISCIISRHYVYYAYCIIIWYATKLLIINPTNSVLMHWNGTSVVVFWTILLCNALFSDYMKYHQSYQSDINKSYLQWPYINISSPGQNGCHFADNDLRCIFVHKKFYIFIRISLKFVPIGPKRKPPCIGGMELVSLSCNRVFISAESVGRGWCKIAIATKWYQFHTTHKCGFLFMPWITDQLHICAIHKLLNKISTAVVKVITLSIMTT